MWSPLGSSLEPLDPWTVPESFVFFSFVFFLRSRSGPLTSGRSALSNAYYDNAVLMSSAMLFDFFNFSQYQRSFS